GGCSHLKHHAVQRRLPVPDQKGQHRRSTDRRCAGDGAWSRGSTAANEIQDSWRNDVLLERWQQQERSCLTDALWILQREVDEECGAEDEQRFRPAGLNHPRTAWMKDDRERRGIRQLLADAEPPAGPQHHEDRQNEACGERKSKIAEYADPWREGQQSRRHIR